MLKKHRILIVDDEVYLVLALEVRLRAHGYEVLKAYDGEMGLEMARKEKPDLILLDIMLPKMNGLKVCELLKNDAQFEKIPVVLFSAMAYEELTRENKRVVADGFIPKPFEVQTLLNEIKNLLTPSSGKWL